MTISRFRLRLHLGLAIFEQVPAPYTTPKCKSYLKRAILKYYNIRENTELKPHDWMMAIQNALWLRRRQPNTLRETIVTRGQPTRDRVNRIFKELLDRQS